jgi:WhiB family transcriptional regulator, redox-sensing transcriptional regulator
MTSIYWREEAACAETDPHLWTDPEGREYPKDRRARIRAAKTICSGCPVIQECLAWALDTDDRESILGGTTASERAGIRRTTQTARAAAAEQTHATVVDLVRQGVSAEAIATRLGCTSETVWRHMRAARESGELEPDLTTRKPPSSDARCGRTAGAAAHKYRGEALCAACRQAMATYRADRRALTGAR